MKNILAIAAFLSITPGTRAAVPMEIIMSSSERYVDIIEDSATISKTFTNGASGQVNVSASLETSDLAYSFSASGTVTSNSGPEDLPVFLLANANWGQFKSGEPSDQSKTYLFKQPMRYTGNVSMSAIYTYPVPGLGPYIASTYGAAMYCTSSNMPPPFEYSGTDEAISENFSGIIPAGTYRVYGGGQWSVTVGTSGQSYYGTQHDVSGAMSLTVEFTPLELELKDTNNRSLIGEDGTAWITRENPPKMPALVATLKDPGGTAQPPQWELTTPKVKLVGTGVTWNIGAAVAGMPLFEGPATLTCAYEGIVITRKFNILGQSCDLIAKSLKWNSGIGGIDATFTIDSPLGIETDVKFYWAKGTETDPIILNATTPIYFKSIPTGSTGTLIFNVPGKSLREAPDGTTQIHMVLDSDNLISEKKEDNNFMCLKDVGFDKNGLSTARLSNLTISVIKEALRFAGDSEAKITDKTRTPEGQATVMFNVLEGPVTEDMVNKKTKKPYKLFTTTLAYSFALYGDYADPLLNLYSRLRKELLEQKETDNLTADMRRKIIAAMTKKIEEIKKNDDPENPIAFRHVSDPATLQVIDIGPRSIGNKELFHAALKKDFRISRYLSPQTEITDIAYHIEIPQKTSLSDRRAIAANTNIFDRNFIIDRTSVKNMFASAITRPADRYEFLITVNPADGLKYRTLVVSKARGPVEQRRIVEVSSNLIDWYSGESHTTIILDNEKLLKVRDNTPITPGTKRYIRLKPRTP